MKTRSSILLLTAVATACGGAQPELPTNVILICMDTVRADHLGCYGYERRETTPALDALAARSTVFVDTSATACWTKPSVPSFLTGTYPLEHGVYTGSSRDEGGAHSDVLPEEAVTLAETFSAAGYDTAAFVRNAQLRRGLGIEQGFDLYVDEAGDARQIRWQAGDWLDERDSDAPFFLYLHLLDAHWPYAVPDEYAARFASPDQVARFRSKDWRALRRAINDGELRLSEEELDSLIALYDGALRFIDDELGRLLAKLERDGLADDTLVCVISDHGEEFLEHGRIGHGHGLYEALLRVPWILHVPGRAPERIEAPCSLTDLYPTLLGAAQVRNERQTPGVDRLQRPDLQLPIFAEHLEKGSYRQSLRRGASKLVLLGRPRPGNEADQEVAAPSPFPAVGSRVEVRVRREADGALLASRVRPSDDPVGDPVEIKGLVTDLDGEGFQLCGVRIRAGRDTPLYGEIVGPDGEPRRLAEGTLAKAKGAFLDGGTLLAEKVKLYPADSEVEREVRGVLTALEPGAFLRVGELSIGLAEDTQVVTPATAGRPRVTRADVIEACLAEGGPWGQFEASRRFFDLSSDPLERVALDGGRMGTALEADLVRLSAILARGRLWQLADRTRLSPTDLQALKAIGYAE